MTFQFLVGVARSFHCDQPSLPNDRSALMICCGCRHGLPGVGAISQPVQFLAYLWQVHAPPPQFNGQSARTMGNFDARM